MRTGYPRWGLVGRGWGRGSEADGGVEEVREVLVVQLDRPFPQETTLGGFTFQPYFVLHDPGLQENPILGRQIRFVAPREDQQDHAQEGQRQDHSFHGRSFQIRFVVLYLLRRGAENVHHE